MRGPPGCKRPERACGLAANDDPFLSPGPALAGLKAQAAVELRKPWNVSKLVDPPLLVRDQQHRQLREPLWLCRERPRQAQRQDHAPLHVGGAGAVEPLAPAPQRPVGFVSYYGVQMPD